MSPVQVPSPEKSPTDEVEITEAALSTYRRLRRALGSRVQLHVARDGGLICEDRRSRARPTIWRISADGAVEADRPYSFARRAFVATQLPHAV